MSYKDFVDNVARVRKFDPPTSHIAASRVNVKKLNQIFIDIVKNRGSNGATSKEIAGIAGKQLNSISPRSALLKRKGLIKDSGKRRNNCTVWVEGDGVPSFDVTKEKPAWFGKVEVIHHKDQWINDVIDYIKLTTNDECYCNEISDYICWSCQAKKLLERAEVL